MRLRLPPDSRAILGRWRVPALVSTLLLVARSAPIGIPSTVCDTAGDLAVTYCNASQSGLCVNSTFECDVLGGIGEAGVGCSAGPCFCCKQATRRPTCADVSSASVSRCLTIHSGLCSANSEDCSALGGFFVYDGAAQPFGCGDDCGCCREVGSTAAPSSALPSASPTSSPTLAPPNSAPTPARGASKGSSKADDEKGLLAAVIILSLLIALCACALVAGGRKYFYVLVAQKRLDGDKDEPRAPVDGERSP